MCDYTGYEFGSYYKDSVCVDGFLFDADSWDGKGYTIPSADEEQIRCPRCNKGINWFIYRLFCLRAKHETGTSIAELVILMSAFLCIFIDISDIYTIIVACIILFILSSIVTAFVGD